MTSIKISEDKHCYASPEQREVIISLIENKILEDTFFLTGGTALSVFFLHHRLSNDLDFFTRQNIDLGEINFKIKTAWKKNSTTLQSVPSMLSVLLGDTKVDFVIDHLSLNDKKNKYSFDKHHNFLVDSILNIASNKLCTIVSRIEPKDFIDFYLLLKNSQLLSLDRLYQDALKKDAIFDDPPSAAYQLEQGLLFVKNNPEILPPLLKEINWKDFYSFYENTAQWLYHKI